MVTLVSVPPASSKMSRGLEELASVLMSVDRVPTREVPTSPPWIEAIRERWRYLKVTHGVNQYDVMEWIGASQPAISALLGDNKRGAPGESPHVERLSVALGIPVPEAVIAYLAIREAAMVGVPDDTMHGVVVLAQDALARHAAKK